MKTIVIFGAGQHGRICKNLAEENGYKVIAFIDDYKEGCIDGVPIYHSLFLVPKYLKHYYFVAYGEISLRQKSIKSIEDNKLKTLNLIDKSAQIGRRAIIGTGNFIYKNTIIYDGAEIGNYNIINSQSLCAIDSKIGHNNNIGFGCKVCGGVKIGTGNYIGAEVVFVSGSRIQDEMIISPCSVVEGKN